MQNMAFGGAAEDAIFMLQANHVDVVEVQKLGRVTVGLHILLSERPPHARGIVIALLAIVYRQSQQTGVSIFRRYSRAQVGGEGGDSTLARKVVADYRDSAGQRRLRLRAWARHELDVRRDQAWRDNFQHLL